MALDITICGSYTNSYVTLDEADAYFENHYHLAKATAWAGLNDDQKEAVLKAAVGVIETLSFRDAFKPIWTQRRVFPRVQDWIDNDYFIPQEVKDAQCEQAIFLVTVDESVMATQFQGVRTESVGAGPVRTATTYAGSGSMVAPLAFEFLRPFVGRSGRIYRA